jgi:hypothetical protein
MKISPYDFSIRSACVLSLFPTFLCVLSLLASTDDCASIMIALLLAMQIPALTLFALLPYVISLFTKNRLQPSSARRKLIYATLGGLAFEIARMVYIANSYGHTGSCI